MGFLFLFSFDGLCVCVLFLLLKYMDREVSGPNVQKKEISGQGTE